VDVFLDPTAYLSLTAQTSVRNLVDRLQVVVQACARRMQARLGPDVVRRPHYRQALIEMSIVLNASLAAHTLQQAIDRKPAGAVRTAYGVYVLDDRSVWAPRCGSDEVQGLATPPGNQSAFLELSDAVLRSARMVALLGG
jgi:carbonic anhydrase